ncbi:MAG: hypothetical protein H0S85_11255 [Desulfovibrionaceae bacterium]|jgi:hypothetical protein|nr:hypothetical protein [Desulfovibrionaceae bacterium]
MSARSKKFSRPAAGRPVPAKSIPAGSVPARGAEIAVHVAVLALVLLRGPLLQPDTGGYLHAAAIRPPLYPLLLQGLQALFGAGFATAALWVQALGASLAVLYCGSALARALRAPDWLRPIFALVLFVPLLPSSSGVANLLLSEGLAYPLFLAAAALLLRAASRGGLRAYALFFLVSGLLVLTRTQFLFLYPVGALCAVWRGVQARSLRAGAAALGVLALCILGATALEKGWNLLQHGKASRPPFTGIQLVAAPLFLAQPGDAALFADPKERRFFERVHAALRENRWVQGEATRLGRGAHGEILHFDNHYNDIVWKTVFPAAREIFAPGPGADFDLPVLRAVDQGTVRVALGLLHAHPARCLKFYAYSLTFGLGGYFAAATLGLVLLATLATLTTRAAPARGASARGAEAQTGSGPAAAAFLVLAAHLANGCLVALVEPVQTRYMIYTATVATCLLVALAVLGLRSLGVPRHDR